MSEFKTFIISLLKRGNINNKHIKQFTDYECMQQFQTAFTHKSFDPDNNWELAELIGDGIVNFSVINYLREWNPQIISVKYLTRLKHNITSKKELARMAENAGFWKFIIMSDELVEKFEAMTIDYKHKNKEYLSMLEDTFEAFIGTVKIIVDEKIGADDFSIGPSVCYNIIKTFLSKLDISLKYNDVFDAKTRYKELCDRRGWEFGSAMKTREIYVNSKRNFETQVIGYPFGNKKKEEDNKECLVVIQLQIKIDTENEAAEQALSILKTQYDIFDIPPNPYHKRN